MRYYFKNLCRDVGGLSWMKEKVIKTKESNSHDERMVLCIFNLHRIMDTFELEKVMTSIWCLNHQHVKKKKKKGLRLLNENDESSKTWPCLKTWIVIDYILEITNMFGIMINFYKIYHYGIAGIINTFRSIIGEV